MLLERLFPILLNSKHIPRILLENTVITVGRLGKISPAEVAMHLPVFLKNWYVACGFFVYKDAHQLDIFFYFIGEIGAK